MLLVFRWFEEVDDLFRNSRKFFECFSNFEILEISIDISRLFSNSFSKFDFRKYFFTSKFFDFSKPIPGSCGNFRNFPKTQNSSKKRRNIFINQIKKTKYNLITSKSTSKKRKTQKEKIKWLLDPKKVLILL